MEKNYVAYIKCPEEGDLVKVYHDLNQQLIGYGIVNRVSTLDTMDTLTQRVHLSRVEQPHKEPDYYFLNNRVIWE